MLADYGVQLIVNAGASTIQTSEGQHREQGVEAANLRHAKVLQVVQHTLNSGRREEEEGQ